MGIANVDSAARVCHAPSTVGLKETIGVAATTCSLQDVIESDLVVLWGTNPANNQPVFMKYLYLAKQRGCRVVVVNPYLEPGLERYWVPSNVESALFGTKMCDLHVPVRPGGDVAFANAALQAADRAGRGRRGLHRRPHRGLGRAGRRRSTARTLDDLLAAGRASTRAQLEAFVDEYAGGRRARSCCGRWASPSTATRVDGVRAIVNLGLARGNVGRDGAGLMPIRGHSGVQGGAEMGAYATALPGGLAGRRRARRARSPSAWGFPVPDRARAAPRPRWSRPPSAASSTCSGCSGGNFLDVLPDPPAVEAALGRVPLRVHQDIVRHLADAGRRATT